MIFDISLYEDNCPTCIEHSEHINKLLKEEKPVIIIASPDISMRYHIEEIVITNNDKEFIHKQLNDFLRHLEVVNKVRGNKT